LLARVTSLPPRSVQRLTPVGVAAGIAAAFNAPIAAVTFTIEEIVGALDHTLLSGIVVAATLAAVIERSILGPHPVIEVAQSYGLDHASSLAIYALLGVAAALVSVAFTHSLLELRRGFRTLRALPRWAHPAIGGLVTGVLALGALRWLQTSGVTGGGYETLGRALAGELQLRVLVVLCVLKLIATVFSYSSGGAGGIFAPSLFVGAMLGGAFGHLDVAVLQHEQRQVGAFALVGMGAVFAGVIRAPITSVLIIFEMTGGYGLVLPLMLANMTSYVLARRWSPLPVYEALLEQDGVSLPRSEPAPHPFEQLCVADAMTVAVASLCPDQSIDDAQRSLGPVSFTVAPVLDAEGVVLGSVSVAQLRRSPLSPGAAVISLMRPAQLIRADAPLLRALVRMSDLGTRRLLVVDEKTGKHLVGVVAMRDLVRAHFRCALGPRARAQGAPLAAEPEGLVMPVATVEGNAPLPQLQDLLNDGSAAALLVRGEYEHRVILPDQLPSFAQHEELARQLVARDLARRVPAIQQTSELQLVARVLSDADADAVVVLDRAGEAPVGIITRRGLEARLLEWMASTTLVPPPSTSAAPP
jgi:chloride channel protein, CIC family